MSGNDAVDLFVQLAQERHRAEVLATAVLVRDPLARLPRVVEVEHRRDRVDAQPVDVVPVEPEARAAHEERAHLVAVVVEHERVPSRDGIPGAGRRARRDGCRRSSARPNSSDREVRRHPVEDHADVVLVQRVDECHEVGRRPEPRRRREVRRGLVAPRSEERVLHDREQLDVREAVLLHVLGEPRRRPRGTGSVYPSSRPAPRPEVDLVDRHRRSRDAGARRAAASTRASFQS